MSTITLGAVVGLIAAAAGVWTLPVRPPAPGVRRPAPGQERSVDPAVVFDLLVVALRAGASIPDAVEVVGGALGGEEGDRLRRASRSLRLGATWPQAWRDHPLGRALGPAWQDGVDPTGLLAQAARSIRSERAASARAAAARLGIRLVLPVGLCLLPAFVLIGLVPVLVGSGIRLLG